MKKAIAIILNISIVLTQPSVLYAAEQLDAGGGGSSQSQPQQSAFEAYREKERIEAQRRAQAEAQRRAQEDAQRREQDRIRQEQEAAKRRGQEEAAERERLRQLNESRQRQEEAQRARQEAERKAAEERERQLIAQRQATFQAQQEAQSRAEEEARAGARQAESDRLKKLAEEELRKAQELAEKQKREREEATREQELIKQRQETFLSQQEAKEKAEAAQEAQRKAEEEREAQLQLARQASFKSQQIAEEQRKVREADAARLTGQAEQQKIEEEREAINELADVEELQVLKEADEARVLAQKAAEEAKQKQALAEAAERKLARLEGEEKFGEEPEVTTALAQLEGVDDPAELRLLKKQAEAQEKALSQASKEASDWAKIGRAGLSGVVREELLAREQEREKAEAELSQRSNQINTEAARLTAQAQAYRAKGLAADATRLAAQAEAYKKEKYAQEFKEIIEERGKQLGAEAARYTSLALHEVGKQKAQEAGYDPGLIQEDGMHPVLEETFNNNEFTQTLGIQGKLDPASIDLFGRNHPEYQRYVDEYNRCLGQLRYAPESTQQRKCTEPETAARHDFASFRERELAGASLDYVKQYFPQCGAVDLRMPPEFWPEECLTAWKLTTSVDLYNNSKNKENLALNAAAFAPLIAAGFAIAPLTGAAALLAGLGLEAAALLPTSIAPTLNQRRALNTTTGFTEEKYGQGVTGDPRQPGYFAKPQDTTGVVGAAVTDQYNLKMADAYLDLVEHAQTITDSTGTPYLSPQLPAYDAKAYDLYLQVAKDFDDPQKRAEELSRRTGREFSAQDAQNLEKVLVGLVRYTTFVQNDTVEGGLAQRKQAEYTQAFRQELVWNALLGGALEGLGYVAGRALRHFAKPALGDLTQRLARDYARTLDSLPTGSVLPPGSAFLDEAGNLVSARGAVTVRGTDFLDVPGKGQVRARAVVLPEDLVRAEQQARALNNYLNDLPPLERKEALELLGSDAASALKGADVPSKARVVAGGASTEEFVQSLTRAQPQEKGLADQLADALPGKKADGVPVKAEVVPGEEKVLGKAADGNPAWVDKPPSGAEAVAVTPEEILTAADNAKKAFEKGAEAAEAAERPGVASSADAAVRARGLAPVEVKVSSGEVLEESGYKVSVLADGQRASGSTGYADAAAEEAASRVRLLTEQYLNQGLAPKGAIERAVRETHGEIANLQQESAAALNVHVVSEDGRKLYSAGMGDSVVVVVGENGKLSVVNGLDSLSQRTTRGTAALGDLSVRTPSVEVIETTLPPGRNVIISANDRLYKGLFTDVSRGQGGGSLSWTSLREAVSTNFDEGAEGITDAIVRANSVSDGADHLGLIVEVVETPRPQGLVSDVVANLQRRAAEVADNLNQALNNRFPRLAEEGGFLRLGREAEELAPGGYKIVKPEADDLVLSKNVTGGREGLIEVLNPTVSRKHFVVTREGPDFFITDRGSTNGTRVNGVDIEPSKPYKLQPQDRVEIGSTKDPTVFQIKGVDEAGERGDLVVTVIHGFSPDKQRYIELPKAKVVKPQNADVVIADGEIVGRGVPRAEELGLTSGRVSREHFLLANEDGRLYIKDMGSTNGTVVNGRRLTPFIKREIIEQDRILLPGGAAYKVKGVSKDGEIVLTNLSKAEEGRPGILDLLNRERGELELQGWRGLRSADGSLQWPFGKSASLKQTEAVIEVEIVPFEDLTPLKIEPQNMRLLDDAERKTITGAYSAFETTLEVGGETKRTAVVTIGDLNFTQNDLYFIAKQAEDAQILDQLGFGPKFLGKVDLGDGRLGYAIEFPDAKLPELAPERITDKTIEEIERIIEHGFFDDFSFRGNPRFALRPDGTPVLVVEDLFEISEPGEAARFILKRQAAFVKAVRNTAGLTEEEAVQIMGRDSAEKAIKLARETAEADLSTTRYGGVDILPVDTLTQEKVALQFLDRANGGLRGIIKGDVDESMRKDLLYRYYLSLQAENTRRVQALTPNLDEADRLIDSFNKKGISRVSVPPVNRDPYSLFILDSEAMGRTSSEPIPPAGYFREGTGTVLKKGVGENPTVIIHDNLHKYGIGDLGSEYINEGGFPNLAEGKFTRDWESNRKITESATQYAENHIYGKGPVSQIFDFSYNVNAMKQTRRQLDKAGQNGHQLIMECAALQDCTGIEQVMDEVLGGPEKYKEWWQHQPTYNVNVLLKERLEIGGVVALGAGGLVGGVYLELKYDVLPNLRDTAATPSNWPFVGRFIQGIDEQPSAEGQGEVQGAKTETLGEPASEGISDVLVMPTDTYGVLSKALLLKKEVEGKDVAQMSNDELIEITERLSSVDTSPKPEGYQSGNLTVVSTGLGGTVSFPAERGVYRVVPEEIPGIEFSVDESFNFNAYDAGVVLVGVRPKEKKGITDLVPKVGAQEPQEAVAGTDGLVTVQTYYDANGNNILDPDEKLLPWAGVKLGFIKATEEVDYRLTEGWNLISFPVKPASVTSARDTLYDVARQGGYATSIARWQDGRFDTYVERGGVRFGNDFAVDALSGYFVRNHVETDFVVAGNPIEDATLNLKKGYNLVGIPAAGYTADSIINAVPQARTVTEFDFGLYEPYVKQEGTVYGEDFAIEETRGYFIRVNQDTTWSP